MAILRHCKVFLRKARGGYFAEVHHGHGGPVFQVYGEGTVHQVVDGAVYQLPHDFPSQVASHVRYQGRHLLRCHGIQC